MNYEHALEWIDHAKTYDATRLLLSGYKLTKLPTELFSLSNWQDLWLDNNQLSRLPPEIGKFSNLCSLDLRGNRFQSIPPELHPLKRLGTLEGCEVPMSEGWEVGLRLDEELLGGLPEEVQSGGTIAILNYLENEA